MSAQILATSFVQVHRPRAEKRATGRPLAGKLAALIGKAVRPAREIVQRVVRALAEERIHRAAMELASPRRRCKPAGGNAAGLPPLR